MCGKPTLVLLLLAQMNVYLRLLAKPHKKDKLLVSNNVLKLACKLLKVRLLCRRACKRSCWYPV